MFQQTMEKLEKALDQLNIKQKGHRVDSSEAWAIVGFWHGVPWKRIENDWINGVISDEDFFDQALMLIHQFADKHNLRRPEVT
jgi:hypothetical protein